MMPPTFAQPELLYQYITEIDAIGTYYDQTTFKHWGWVYGSGKKAADGRFLGAHIIYSIALIAWVCANMFPFFAILKLLKILRVPKEYEESGKQPSIFPCIIYINMLLFELFEDERFI